MPDAEAVEGAKTLLDRLAKTPRFAGSPEEEKARAICREELERAGFTCTELPFDYSQWPGRWGQPIAAAFQAATILVVARTAVHQGALAALILGAALLIALNLASGDARRRWTAQFPFQRASSVNLEARRGNPKVWLLAHIDSKSQTMPMLIRVASSIVLSLVTASTLVAILVSIVWEDPPQAVWHGLAIGAVLGAVPTILCWTRAESPGAVDNASGVAAVLIASQAASRAQDLGVLITSGEEIGLAGARAWASKASGEMLAINCDTVDDEGRWRCMYTGAKPARITRAAETISTRLGLNLAVGRLIPGILADSMAFADRGIESVTVSRATFSTLARIHTRRDTSIALAGSGVAVAGALLASLVEELT